VAGDLRHLLEQFLEEGAGEEIVGLGQDAGELRVVLLDGPHGLVDLGANVLRLREVEQEIEPGVGGQIQDALGVVGGGFVHPTAATGGGGGLLQPGTLQGEADLGEAEEDDPQNRARVLLGLQAGVGAKLIGGGPETLLERLGEGVFFRGGDPGHERWVRSFRKWSRMPALP
jgi:hypothetical protein